MNGAGATKRLDSTGKIIPKTAGQRSHMKTARQSLAAAAGHVKVHAEPEALLRRRRQRNRTIGKRAQIGDHVGALAILGDAGEAHRGAGNKALGIGNELVEVVVGPGTAFGLHGSREIKPAASFASMVVDDPEQIWADTVGAALFEGMAGSAFLRCRSTLLDRRGLQQLLDRLGRRRRGFLGAAVRRFLHRDFVTRFFRHHGRENRACAEARHQQNQAGGQNGAENFIEFEGVHFRSGSRPEGRLKAGGAAADERQESGFRTAPSAAMRYRFARALATRINAPTSDQSPSFPAWYQPGPDLIAMTPF